MSKTNIKEDLYDIFALKQDETTITSTQTGKIKFSIGNLGKNPFSYTVLYLQPVAQNEASLPQSN